MQYQVIFRDHHIGRLLSFFSDLPGKDRREDYEEDSFRFRSCSSLLLIKDGLLLLPFIIAEMIYKFILGVSFIHNRYIAAFSLMRSTRDVLHNNYAFLTLFLVSHFSDKNSLETEASILFFRSLFATGPYSSLP